MSYSFQVRGSTKAEAIEKVKAEMAKVVEVQPVHAADQAQAVAAAESFVALLPDDDARDVTVSLSGSVSSSATGLWSGGVSVYAARADKQ